MKEFATFLESHSFAYPVACAVISVYVQFIGSILLVIGYKTRMAACVLILNFIVAIVFVHIKIGDSIEGMTPAFAMLFGCLALFFTGADKISIDHMKYVRSFKHVNSV